MAAPIPVRKIIHVDMDAFYASVEQHDRPELKGKPVVVGGSPESRGVVAAASYEARKFGVRSAMSCAKAHRLCPQAHFVPPNFTRYVEVSRQVREVFKEVTPHVEPLSLDEAYLDVTENLKGEPRASELARWIRAEIRARTGLTASAGVGPNKFVAKLASDYKKPDGLTVVRPERVLEFVAPLPVEALWGVGPVTAKKLHAIGLRHVGDLRKVSLSELRAHLGSFADFIRGLAFGEDGRPVESEWTAKSVGSETTFDVDHTALEPLLDTLNEQARELEESLRSDAFLARTVTLKVRYDDFKTITRSRSYRRPFFEAPLLYRTAAELLRSSTEAGSRPVRLIGISVSNLIGEDEPLQLWLDLPEDLFI